MDWNDPTSKSDQRRARKDRKGHQNAEIKDIDVRNLFF